MKINVKDYGAIGDGLSNDTISIQKAIDACELSGSEVIVPKGSYLCGTLKLKSNITLNIEKSAAIIGSEDFDDYSLNEAGFVDAVGDTRGRCLILMNGSENITIKGGGTISGRGGMFGVNQEHFHERPFLVRVVDCDNVSISDIKLQDSAAWCLHLLDSDHIEVKDLVIDNRVNTNNDAIDIDSCRNVTISGCDISSSDDALCLKTTKDKPCENIEISNCRVTTNWAAFKIGTESVGDYKNIVLKDCYFYDVNGCAIKIVPVDGGNIENVVIDNIVMKNCTGPIFISLGERLNKYFEDQRDEPGYIKGVEIKNIKADVVGGKSVGNDEENKREKAKGCIVISGLASKKVENIHIHDCECLMPGGVDDSLESVVIPEMGTNYPEFYSFGTLPAYGYYIRHAKGVKIERNKIQLKKEDRREMLYCEDAEMIHHKQ